MVKGKKKKNFSYIKLFMKTINKLYFLPDKHPNYIPELADRLKSRLLKE